MRDCVDCSVDNRKSETNVVKRVSLPRTACCSRRLAPASWISNSRTAWSFMRMIFE